MRAFAGVPSILVALVLSVCVCLVCGYRRLSSSDNTYFANESSTNVQEAPDSVYSSIRRRLGDISSENHRVNNLPGLAQSIKQYAGHITIDAAKNSNIFYWLFEPDQNAESLPLLIWLNGGPGCSSMDGLWLELGPLRLDASGSTVSINRASWHNAANILFVDQPVGTGFAYTKSKAGYATNDDMINSQFYAFLTQFFALHPRYVTTEADGKVHTRPFFMSGESHAGHYIPTMAKYILDRNDEVKSGKRGDLVISLQGIALGNPWIDPYHQYDASDFAHGLGIINQGQKHRLKELEKKCQGILKSGKFNNPACFSLLDKIIDSTAVGGTDRVLMYDARKYVRQTSSFPPGHETLERYLNRADVKQAIHATGSPNKFEECSNPPYYALSHQDGKGVTAELVNILDRDLRVLVFAGQYDLICNHMGIEKVLRGLAWKNQRDWLMAPPAVWHLDGKPAGFVRAHQNLEFLIVLDAGHMVPMDQPKVGLSMIQTFLQDRRFGKVQSKLGVALSSPQEDGSSIIQCPRFLESLNGSILQSDSGVKDSDGSGLIQKWSLWAGGTKKKKAGNGRRARIIRQQNTGGSRHLRSFSSGQQRGEVPVDRESMIHSYCLFATSASDSCCISLEWMLQTNSAGNWASAGRLTERTRDLAALGMQSDIEEVVRRSLAPHASAPPEHSVIVVARFGRASHSEQDIIAVDSSIGSVDASAASVFVTAKVCGRADDVEAAVSALILQGADSSSQLRTGLFTSHLAEDYTVIVAHNRVT